MAATYDRRQRRNPLSQAELVVRHDFTGYWLNELLPILGAAFGWWAADRVVKIDGREAVPMAAVMRYVETYDEHDCAGICVASRERNLR